MATNVARQARRVADQYTTLFKSRRGLGIVGNCLEMPDVWVCADRADRCAELLREALASAVQRILEVKQQPPEPLTVSKRDCRVKVMVSAHEKLRLERLAHARGYRGVEDFVREAALDAARATAV